MRKLIAAICMLGVCAVIGATAAVTTAAPVEGCLNIDTNPSSPNFGKAYFEGCTKPKITVVKAASAACTKKNSTYTTGTFKVQNQALIHTIVVKFGSKVIFSKSFGTYIANVQLRGTSSYTVGPLKIGTAGLAKGAHSFTITTTDWRRTPATTTQVVRFTVCATKPKTAG